MATPACLSNMRVPGQQTSHVKYRAPVTSVGLLQKVPPTTVAPTYKLTLPSEFVLTHMPDMMAGEFVMISADGTQSFNVSIVPRYAIDFSQCHCNDAFSSQQMINPCLVHAGETRTNTSIQYKQKHGNRSVSIIWYHMHMLSDMQTSRVGLTSVFETKGRGLRTSHQQQQPDF